MDMDMGMPAFNLHQGHLILTLCLIVPSVLALFGCHILNQISYMLANNCIRSSGSLDCPVDTLPYSATMISIISIFFHHRFFTKCISALGCILLGPKMFPAYVSVTPWQDHSEEGGEDDESQEDNERSGGSGGSGGS